MSQWNELADVFGSDGDSGGNNIPDVAADNIYIAWPSIIKGIEKNLINTGHLHALDFGCGGGLFCKKLHQLGFQVSGCDESTALVMAAQENTPQAVSVSQCETIFGQQTSFDLITSIMVFPFIEEFERVLEKLTSLLKRNGLVIFAAFNPAFIKANSDDNFFSGFEDSKSGYIQFKSELKIPLYNRSESDYRMLFEQYGYEQVYLDYPAFNKAFLTKYPMPFATETAEYLIQGFIKK